MIRVVIVGTLLMVIGASLDRTSTMTATKALPNGYWPVEKSQSIIDKTQTIRLAPDLARLTPGERKAVESLLKVGQIFQGIYEQQRHPQATKAYVDLLKLDETESSPATKNLLSLYRLFQGPIATTLDNKREPFLPVSPLTPGKNMYPAGLSKEQIEQAISAGTGLSSRESILDQRTVVRQLTSENVGSDLDRLRGYPVLQTLHPKLLSQLTQLETDAAKKDPAVRIYAVPYSLAYADQ